MTATYRRGTTVIVVAGPRTGTIGTSTGNQVGDKLVVELRFGPNRGGLEVDVADLAKTPHPLSWYDRTSMRSHSCDGCDELQGILNGRRVAAYAQSLNAAADRREPVVTESEARVLDGNR